MDPAEVILSNFIGVALLYCISAFIIFFSAFTYVTLSRLVKMKLFRQCITLQKNIFSARMITDTYFLWLPVAHLLQRTGKGGEWHA